MSKIQFKFLLSYISVFGLALLSTTSKSELWSNAFMTGAIVEAVLNVRIWCKYSNEQGEI